MAIFNSKLLVDQRERNIFPKNLQNLSVPHGTIRNHQVFDQVDHQATQGAELLHHATLQVAALRGAMTLDRLLLVGPMVKW